MRLKSFNVLEGFINRNKKKWQKILNTDSLPSVDTIGRKIEHSDIEGLRKINREAIHKLRRNKAFDINKASLGLISIGTDGHETNNSKKRKCKGCKRRKKNINGKVVYEYYHSYVFCQVLLCKIPVIIDIEPILPGLGELTAAKRLIKRILEEQPRIVDVLCFDALYLDSELLNLLEKKKKFWVVVLKNENREAYKEVDKMLLTAEKIEMEINERKVTLYDLYGLVGWDKLDKTFRAVVSDEEWHEWELQENGIKTKVKKTSHWRWVTNMPSIYKPEHIYRFGHGRWNEEERGFNNLSNQCHLNHPFHHHPIALLAMLWIISIAFNLSYAFYILNLKTELKKKIIPSRTQLVLCMIETFRDLSEVIFSNSS